jgi:Putative Zn-dependent protease, contains TPR repeats
MIHGLYSNYSADIIACTAVVIIRLFVSQSDPDHQDAGEDRGTCQGAENSYAGNGNTKRSNHSAGTDSCCTSACASQGIASASGSISTRKTGGGEDGACRGSLAGQCRSCGSSWKKEQAAASLERALRIEPKNPLLWHKLSRLRLQEKHWEQAIALAKKSNVLASGNSSLQAENWRIIAQASKALGDEAGMAAAVEMVRQLEK